MGLPLHGSWLPVNLLLHGSWRGRHVPAPVHQNKNKTPGSPPQRQLLCAFTPREAMMQCLLSGGAAPGGDPSSCSLTQSTWVISPPTHVVVTAPTPHSEQSPGFFLFCPLQSLSHLTAFGHAVPCTGCAYRRSSHFLLLLILQPKHHLSQGLSYSGSPS